MRVYLVRHAQSENNVLAAPGLDCAERSADPGVTARGRRQIDALEARFARARAENGAKRIALYASPMRRCLLTANAMARGMQTRAEVMVDAHEHGGCFRGARGRDDADGDASGDASRTSRAIGERGMTRDEIEREFDGVDASDVRTIGWWDASRGCETVAEAQTRASGVARYLMDKARAMANKKEEEMDVCIVTHGMFIDMLLKTLFDVPRTRGKQGALFCSQNACVHELHFDIAEDGDTVGLRVFNDVTHIPEEARSGGTVDGLSEAYTNEGSA